MGQEGAFTMIEAESGTQYRAHIVKSEEQNCFVDYYTFKENMTFTQCLEMADSWAAPSFHYDKSTRYCQLYKDWRYRMYSNCRRGSNDNRNHSTGLLWLRHRSDNFSVPG